MQLDWPAVPMDRVSFRNWFSWGLLLVLIYLVVAALCWHRTFIDTEAWALLIAGMPVSEQLAQIRADMVHPPLMYFVQRGWLAAFGHTDNAAHALPLAIIPPAILLFTLLATRITAYWRLLSFFLATSLYPAFNTPSLVRMYGLAMLLVIAGILLWDDWQANPRTITLAAWTAVMILLLYTHLFGSLILLSFLVWNWLQGPRKMAFTIAAAIPGLAFLPWFLYVLPIYRARGLATNLAWVHPNLRSAIPELFFNFLGGIYFDSFLLSKLAIAVSAVIHLGLLVLWWRNRARIWPPRSEAGAPQRWFWMATLLGGLPILILFSFSLLVSRAFEARFVLGAMLPYSIALFLLCQMSGRAGRIALLCVLLPWRIAVIGKSFAAASQPSAVRSQVELVAAQVRAGDHLLLGDRSNSSIVYWEWTCRLHRSEHIEVLQNEPGIPPRVAAIRPISLDRLDLAGVRRVWLFQSNAQDRRGLAEVLAAGGFVRVPLHTEDPSHLLLFERSTENGKLKTAN